LFHVADLTRTFTAVAIMQLAERGQLALSDSIAASPITVTQLLTRDDAAFDTLAGIIESAAREKHSQYMRTRVLNGAGLSASVADLTRWAALHVDRDPALLSPASYDTMYKHQRDGEHANPAMALGRRLEHHGGEWLPSLATRRRGFSALLTLHPSQRRAIVVLANGEARCLERKSAGSSNRCWRVNPICRRNRRCWLAATFAGRWAVCWRCPCC
jgi:hypothetical protein